MWSCAISSRPGDENHGLHLPPWMFPVRHVWTVPPGELRAVRGMPIIVYTLANIQRFMILLSPTPYLRVSILSQDHCILLFSLQHQTH